MTVPLLILAAALAGCFLVDGRRPAGRRELTPARLREDSALPAADGERLDTRLGETAFDVVLRGYRMDQVDAFIGDLQGEVSGLEEENEALRGRLRAARAEAAPVAPVSSRASRPVSD